MGGGRRKGAKPLSQAGSPACSGRSASRRATSGPKEDASPVVIPAQVFQEAFGRYLPADGGSEVHTCTQRDETGTSDIFKVHTEEDGCAPSKSKKSSNDGIGAGVHLGGGCRG